MKKGILFYLLACVVIALIASLGIKDSESSSSSVDGGADPADVQVIEDWADTLSSGDPEGAAALFAVPSVVSNGTPPIELASAADVLSFNQSLPCGAELIKAVPDGDRIDATFRLKNRPGGDCGAGVGGLAGTAFTITDGKITEWLRLDNLGAPEDQKPTGPIV